ncbi:MAG: cyclic peptide export ABC transporter [Saccharospirillum sp.]|nr:cyclic peptide export ABC transporter [Saccharospirillum sp.]
MNLIRTLIGLNRIHFSVGIVMVMLSAGANIGAIHFINLTLASEGQVLRDHPLWLAALLIAALVLGISSQMMMSELGYRIIYQLRGRLLQQVLNTTYEKMLSVGSPRIYAAITKDIRAMQDGFMVAPFFVYSLSIVVCALIYMFVLDWRIAFLVVGALMLSGVLAKFLTNKFQTLNHKERELEDDLFSAYREVLDGHKELQLNQSLGQKLIQRIMSGPAYLSMRYRTLADRYIVVNIHFMSNLTLFLIAVVFWLVYALNWGSLALATSFALTLMFVRQPINMALNQLPALVLARIALRKMASLDLGSDEQPEPVEPWPPWQRLTFQQVGYHYDKDVSQFKLGPINLEIDRGDLVFITGRNGAGKTTLIRLILGLLTPRSGKIALDGKEVVADQKAWYRHGFSAVLADFHLFSDLSASDQDAKTLVDQWLHKLDLSDKVSLQEGRYTTTALSTGQRKRLAMISAVLEARGIMVLDEWAADQDPVFRTRFYREILPELKARGYTIIVVSHDDRYFHVADRLLALENGALVELETSLQTS